jgi:glutathione S-transferase
MRFFDFVAPQVGVTPDADAVSRGRQDLEHPIAVLDKRLSVTPWMLGSEFSLVDCSIGTDLVALAASTFDWSRYPAVGAYISRVRARDAWHATSPRY